MFANYAIFANSAGIFKSYPSPLTSYLSWMRYIKVGVLFIVFIHSYSLEIFRVQVRLSVVSSTDYNNILSIFGLAKPKPITLDVVPTRKSLPDHFFNWGVETEPAQMDKCLNWIKTLITLPPNLVMFSVASQSSFLTLPIGDASRYILKSTTDIAIVSKIYVENLDTICGLKVVIELKKTVSEAAHRQVVMQLLAASVSSSFPVLAILTDLKQFWQFMWLDKSGIQETCFDLCHAISFIDQILLEDGCNPIIKMYTMEAYLKEKEGIQRPQGPGSPAVVGKQGVKQILSRPRVDGYDIMPKGDVGNMEEFYDEMSKEEIEQHKLNVVIRHVTSSAYWQSFASDTVLSV